MPHRRSLNFKNSVFPSLLQATCWSNVITLEVKDVTTSVRSISNVMLPIHLRLLSKQISLKNVKFYNMLKFNSLRKIAKRSIIKNKLSCNNRKYLNRLNSEIKIIFLKLSTLRYIMKVYQINDLRKRNKEGRDLKSDWPSAGNCWNWVLTILSSLLFAYALKFP